MIAIYEGEGAFWEGKELGIRLSARQILDGGLQNVKMLILPGGRDIPYHRALRGLGNEKVRRFVEEGGTYLGICAGAYYGAEEVVFDQGFPLEVCQKRELRFFEGKAIGPIFGGGTFCYKSQKGARLVKIQGEKEPFYAYYNGGCRFEGDLSHARVLGVYLDLPGSFPAIIEVPIGKGRAILSGVHLEKGLIFSGHGSQNFPADQVKVEMIDGLSRIGAAVG